MNSLLVARILLSLLATWTLTMLNALTHSNPLQAMCSPWIKEPYPRAPNDRQLSPHWAVKPNMLLAVMWLKKPCSFTSYLNFLVTNSRPPLFTVITWVLLHWWRTPFFTPDPSILTSSFTIHMNVLMRKMCSSSISLLLPCLPISWQKHYHIQSMKNLWLYSASGLLVTAIAPCYHSEGECWNMCVLVTTHPDASTRHIHIHIPLCGCFVHILGFYRY